jgi:hypothetical protein
LICVLAAIAQPQDAAIHGVVRDHFNGELLTGAAVSIKGNGIERSTVSGANGEFRFDGLMPGNYSVRCSLDGYLAQPAVSTLAQPEKTTLLRRVVIDLTLVSTFEGTVFDEDGKPMPGVSLYTGSDLRSTTDSEGRYRIENLPAGEYRFDLRIPLAIRKQALKHNPDNGLTFGYPNTEYYPGTADPQAAVRIPVTGGIHLRGLDMRLRRVPLVDLSGRIVERVGGEPLATGHVALAANFPATADESFAARPVDQTGAFRFEAIQPGSYSLLIYRGDPGSDLPYVHPVDVGKAGIVDLAIGVPAPQRLEGVVRTSGDDVEWTGRVIVSLMPVQHLAPSRRLEVTTKEFVLDGLPPGRFTFVAQSAAEEKGSNRRLVVGGFHLGALDLTTSPAMVSESGNPPLEIRLSGKTGRIAVKAASADGSARAGWLFVVPIGIGGMGTMMNSVYRLDPAGAATVNDLVPGFYDLFVNMLEDPGPPGPRTRVEVKASETAIVQLRIPER